MEIMEKIEKAMQETMKTINAIIDDPNTSGNEKIEIITSMVSISEGNRKTGKFPSVSLLPLITCNLNRCKGTCGERCYAVKLCRIYPTVLEAYARNTAIFKLYPVAYWNAIDKAMQRADTFRFHISGDIPNTEYMNMVHYFCKKHSHCKTLMFTKQYEIVNRYLSENKKPENLQIMFSGWTNLKPINPYNLPETTVYEKDTDFNPKWTPCTGNCLSCRRSCSGCFNAKNGETVAFKIH